MLTKTINLYKNREDVTLTTYITAEKGELNMLGKRPAVLICPGGAYLGCSDREAEPVALKFAAMGYHAFVLRYSTYDEGKGFPDLNGLIGNMPVKEHCVHPNPVRDIGKAMLTIHENADDWFVDMNRIAVCGFSAGGHNAAMYGVYWHHQLITDFLGTQKENIKPAAMILCYPLIDYLSLSENRGKADEDSFAAALGRAASTAFFGTANPSIDMLKSASPHLHVSAETPPAFIWTTYADELLPAHHSLQMAHAMAKNSIPFEMHIFEDGPHGLSLGTQATSVNTAQLDRDSAKWIDLAECWLGKRFAIKLPNPK